MAMSKYFEKCPPFPLDVPVVPLPTISLRELEDSSEEATEKLFQACQEWGFFFLDLRGSEKGASLLKDGENMFDLTVDTYALDQNTLDNYAYNPPHDLTGYKRKGKLKTDDGKVDCMELYSINQDEMLGNSPPRKNADPIDARREEVQQFIRHSHEVTDIVFTQLDKKLGLEPGTLSALGSLDQKSDTSVRLLLNQPQSNSHPDTITLGGHTDIGTITLLFNVIGGLQILPAGLENKMENWKYVKPELGCIVNIGDTVVEWTGGVLRSSLHRVVAAPGEQASVPRMSVAYLARARNDASMQRLVSDVIPPLEDGEEGEKRTMKEWAAWRALQVMRGELKPQTSGGKMRATRWSENSIN